MFDGITLYLYWRMQYVSDKHKWVVLSTHLQHLFRKDSEVRNKRDIAITTIKTEALYNSFKVEMNTVALNKCNSCSLYCKHITCCHTWPSHVRCQTSSLDAPLAFVGAGGSVCLPGTGSSEPSRASPQEIFDETSFFEHNLVLLDSSKVSGIDMLFF